MFNLMKVSLSTRPRKRCLRMRGEINLEVGTGSIVLGEPRWLVIIYSHPVRNVLLFEIQSRKATNNNLEYFQLKRHQKAVVLWKLKQSKFSLLVACISEYLFEEDAVVCAVLLRMFLLRLLVSIYSCPVQNFT